MCAKNPQMNEALASKANVASVQGILDRLDSSRESAMYSTQELSTVVSSLREEITTKVGMREVRATCSPPGSVVLDLKGLSAFPRRGIHPCLKPVILRAMV